MIPAGLPGATPSAQERELAAQLGSSLANARGMLHTRLEDAIQHASAGQLGRAQQRVDELRVDLSRHLSDARASFYHSAFHAHRSRGLSPATHDLSIGPHPAGEAVVRGTPLFGRDHYDDLGDVLEDAKAALQSAALASGQPAAEPSSWLENWRTDQAERIGGTMHRMLSDSQIGIFEAVGQILVKPEFR
jgi:hypothetical protein